MSLLETISERLGDCLVAAWVDTRTGDVIEQHAPDPRLASLPPDDGFITSALDAAAEVMRSRERPPRMVLLSAHHVHIVQRARDTHRVLVVVCERSPNLGLAVSVVRALVETEGA
jgi:archaeosine-15-forming tRNA-guanine transglycosylase